jgi:hypothetical protein
MSGMKLSVTSMRFYSFIGQGLTQYPLHEAVALPTNDSLTEIRDRKCPGTQQEIFYGK